MAFNLNRAIAAAKQKAASPQPATDPAKPRGILFGTGITKKLAEQEQTRLEHDTAASAITLPQAPPTSHDQLHHALPTTLMGNITLDESQQAAVNGLINQQFGCLIGAAGTGKTTTVKALIAALMAQAAERNQRISIAFAAFTGRAVQQLKRALPIEFHKSCDTIHGLLEFAPEVEEYTDEHGELRTRRIFIEHRNAGNPLDQNIIILDECGMLAIDLFNKVVAACRPNTRIYMLGDINQLPPIHGRSVLGFAGLKWPTFELNRIHRTEENSIIDGAWKILNGKMPDAVDGRVAMIRISDDSIKAFQQVIGAVQKLSNAGKFNALTDAIIVPQNTGTIGQEHINERLCSFFNPLQVENDIPLNPRTIVTAGFTHVSFAAGDKVMVTKNDREQGLTNGMIGIIKSIRINTRFRGQIVGDLAGAALADDFELDVDSVHAELAAMELSTDADEREQQASHIITVLFQNVEQEIEFSTAGAINTLRHAYAFTCHKAQGGEYPLVLIMLHSANLNMLSREWLYTAWTRAREKIVLFYNSRGIQHALNRQQIVGKTVRDKLIAFQKLSERSAAGDDSIKTPNLPEPRTID